MTKPLIGILLSLCSLTTLCAQSLEDDLAHLRKVEGRDRVDESVRKALKYLAAKQDPTSGAFNQAELPNTLTALSCIAFMANGNQPGDEAYGKTLRKAILYLTTKSQKGNGYFGHEANGRMYSQGICTIALCEAYGMMPTVEENKRVGESIKRSLKVIIDAQVEKKGTFQGGWHYHPKSTQADLSVSAWQIMALRSALNCNIEVPEAVIESATAFVRRVYNQKFQTFTYDGVKITHCMRAAGVISLLALGAGKSDADLQKIRNSASSLINYNPAQGDHFYCQSFYLALCANMLGEKYVKQIQPKLENALIALQEKDGSFKKHSGSLDGIYSTAFAVMALSVRRQLLPLTQN